MAKNKQPTQSYDSAQFERSTRQLRWACIVGTVLTFPPSAPQYGFVLGLLIFSCFYNALRHWPRLLQNHIFSSPLLIIGVDLLAVCGLVYLAGSVATPYSAFLFFALITAAYRYKLVGVLVVTTLEVAMLVAVMAFGNFPAIELSAWRMIAIILIAFLSLGMLVVQLTHLERKEREALARLSKAGASERAHLLVLVNSLSSAIFVVSGDGRIILCNDAASALVGRQEELQGLAFGQVMPLFARTSANQKPVDLLADSTGAQHRRDLCFKLPSGQTLDMDIVVHAAKLDTGDQTDYVIVCEDITNERTLDEQRSEFIAVASHELRTPIAIMEAALSMALSAKEPLPEKTKPLIEQAHTSARFLAGLIKDLSTLAEAKNDNLPIQLQQVKPMEMVKQVAKDFEAQAEQKGLSLIIDVDHKAPTVLSTERHIREVLQNYLTNAIKYSSSGDIIIAAKPAGNGGVVFSVADNGIGISPDNQKHLFRKFFRVEDYRTRSTGGTGLGLYLCQELASRLGAKVWCKSASNKGSTFYLQVPPFSGLKRDEGEVVKAQVSNLVDAL